MALLRLWILKSHYKAFPNVVITHFQIITPLCIKGLLSLFTSRYNAFFGLLRLLKRRYNAFQFFFSTQTFNKNSCYFLTLNNPLKFLCTYLVKIGKHL